MQGENELRMNLDWAVEWKPGPITAQRNLHSSPCWYEPNHTNWNFFCLELTWTQKIRIQMLVVPHLPPSGLWRKGQWCCLSHKLFISWLNARNKQGAESSWACLRLFPGILFLATQMQIRSTLLKLVRYFIIYLSNWCRISEADGSRRIRSVAAKYPLHLDPEGCSAVSEDAVSCQDWERQSVTQTRMMRAFHEMRRQKTFSIIKGWRIQ